MNKREKHQAWKSLKFILKDILSVVNDKAKDEIIDERVRSDVVMKGSRLWILMFAIFIASIGLNVNSTAVVIGAMLISPLMGPIIGIGYGAGINDFKLIHLSFKNLLIATVMALLTSTLYFFISPLHTAQSELLARTTPTLWDVLIGFFGGLAGIIGITRKEKSNVIPGVAIATALMPPLCTAGFGLATGNFKYFFGAFYLYTINSVFIAFSSFIVIRMFNVAKKKYVNPEFSKKVQHYITIAVVLTMLPSFYLTYKLVEEEIFKAKAIKFVNEQFNFKSTKVAQIKINPHKKVIEVFLIGEHVDKKELNRISGRLSNLGLKNATLKVYQTGKGEKLDVSALKADILMELYKNSQAELEAKEKQIETLKKEIEVLQKQIEISNVNRKLYSDVPKELETIFPKVKDVILSQSYNPDVLILNAKAVKPLTQKEKEQIKEWLKIRTKEDNVVIYIR